MWSKNSLKKVNFNNSGSASIRESVFKFIRGKVVNYSVNIHACRVIQCIIDFGYDNISVQKTLVSEIQSFFLDVALDQYGNYVIQKLIQSAKNSLLGPIYEEINENIEKLAINNFGSRIVQRSFERYFRDNVDFT